MEVKLPESLLNIDEGVFNGCYNLKTINIPKGIKFIDETTFRECNNVSFILDDAQVHPHVSNYLVSQIFTEEVDGIEWNFELYNGIAVEVQPADKSNMGEGGSITSVVIPDTLLGFKVRTIKESAFSDCAGLTSITIPKIVVKIGKSAFSKCTNLNSINIPNCVVTIENSAFNNCSSLEMITLPDNIIDIGECAFSHCRSLISINIPTG